MATSNMDRTGNDHGVPVHDRPMTELAWPPLPASGSRWQRGEFRGIATWLVLNAAVLIAITLT